MEDRIIMDSIIVDRFYLKAPRFTDVCDCSLDKSVVDEQLSHFKEHNHFENVYRMLHHFGYLSPESQYTIKFNLVANTVFFELNITKLLNDNPMLKESFKKLFRGEDLAFWNRLIEIAEKE